jgi:Ran GTPase-activating protein (RanGAP) involved in mRNA processing and transport
LLDEHPELYDQIEDSLEKFKSDEKNRVKEFTPNLGDMLSKLAVSRKYKWSDIIGPYLEEQMDRQVFWMIKDIPELEKMENDTEFDDDRVNASFKSTLVGYHLTLFYSVFIGKVINREGRSREKLLKSSDDMYGRLSQGEEESIQRYCNDIRKVGDYYAYFKMLGIPFPSKKELFEAIKKSIKNSSRKGYHGPEDALHALPEKNVMIEEYKKTISDSLESLMIGDKLPDAADPKWKKAVINRFPWVADYTEVLTEKEALNPATIAYISDEMKTSNMQMIQYNQGKKSIMGSGLHKLLEVSSYSEYNPGMTWMELFMKLEFERFMELFIYNPDFKTFHKYLDILAPHVSCLCLLIGAKKGIKSGYHWLTSILTKLPKLTTFKLYANELYGISLEIIKCLQKGANNFVKANGKLLKLEIDRVRSLYDQKLLPFFKTFPDLRVINMNQMNVTQAIGSVLNKVLTNFKNIQELNLVDCKMDLDAGKEIADGLMRAKQLEILRIAKNPNLGPSVVSIIYNLAFSPKITLIDISEIPMTTKANETIESLYKLLSISGSLKVLNMNKTLINNAATELFFKALGGNKTLNAICMDGSVFNSCANLGKAIAINTKRNGALEYVSIVGSTGNANNFKLFIESFWVSDRDEEYWYGDPAEATKMHGEQAKRKFYCGLKELIVNNNASGFGHTANSLKYVKYADYPKIIHFLCENKALEVLKLEDCKLYKGDSEILCLGLKCENYLSSLKILNLAKNNLRKEGAQALATNLSQDKTILEELDISRNYIGVAGAKALAKMLTVNKSLKVLNMFANAIDVDGARALKESLKVNNTLVKLDLGCNRLREKGVKEIAEGLNLNKDSAMKTLGLRLNFISDDGIIEFFNKAVLDQKCHLTHIYIKGNYYTEHNIIELQKKVQEKAIILHVDVFEKLKNLKQSKLERSIWISPIWSNTQDSINKIKSFFEDHEKLGIVIDIRLRTGPKIPGKPKENIYAIVEFAHSNSVLRALRAASKKRAVISGNKIKIYKAGSGVAVNVKPTSKHRR